MTDLMFTELKEEKEITGENVNTIIRMFIRDGLTKAKKERKQ